MEFPRGARFTPPKRLSLDDAVPLLTGDPTKSAEIFLELEIKRRVKLEQMADKELLTQAARELAITTILISQALCRRVDSLVLSNLKEVAILLKAIASSVTALTMALRQSAEMKTHSSGERS
jgi:hypothetical protein